MSDEASGSGEMRRNLRSNLANTMQHGNLEDFETSYDNIDIMQWEDDIIALNLAAGRSCLPPNQLTMHEMDAFPELKKSRGSTALYLYLRNKLLQMWHRNPRMELTFRDFMNELPSPYDSDPLFARRIYEFLQRFGYINVGIFNRLTALKKVPSRRVIVIGAGIAGIIAARQLMSFGLDVVLLEARSRIGGRISTYIKPLTGVPNMENKNRNQIVAELGASFIYGAFENPLMTLCKQFEVRCLPVCLDQCPIYDPTGKAVEPRRVRLVERAFNYTLYASTYMACVKGITELNGRKLCLGETFNVMLKEQDYRLQTRRISYFGSYENVLNKLKVVQDTMALKKDEIIRLHAAYEELKEKEGCTNLSEDEQMENEILLKCAVKDIDDAIQAYESLDSNRREINDALAELSRNEPSAVYMNEMDKRILDFHIANLEYFIGSSIDDVSLKYWNQKASYGLEGPNMYVAEGLIKFLIALSSDWSIHLDHVVQQIQYDHEKVSVKCLVNGTREVIFDGDCVLCTIPLGVLKRSIRNRNNVPLFYPELPRWKIDAINSLGFGNVNKVMLFFEKPFWENTRVFGQISDTMCATSRGEMFMFQAHRDKPILIALISGDSANALEEAPNDIIVYKIMNFLSAVFGPACPKEPTDVIITRWRTDRFSCGAFSYVSSNCTLDAFDNLAAPVKDSAGYDRVFFAGEHTCREHPGTIHGAYLSGLREAGRIADLILGVPYGAEIDPNGGADSRE